MSGAYLGEVISEQSLETFGPDRSLDQVNDEDGEDHVSSAVSSAMDSARTAEYRRQNARRATLRQRVSDEALKICDLLLSPRNEIRIRIALDLKAKNERAAFSELSEYIPKWIREHGTESLCVTKLTDMFLARIMGDGANEIPPMVDGIDVDRIAGCIVLFWDRVTAHHTYSIPLSRSVDSRTPSPIPFFVEDAKKPIKQISPVQFAIGMLTLMKLGYETTDGIRILAENTLNVGLWLPQAGIMPQFFLAAGISEKTPTTSMHLIHAILEDAMDSNGGAVPPGDLASIPFITFNPARVLAPLDRFSFS